MKPALPPPKHRRLSPRPRVTPGTSVGSLFPIAGSQPATATTLKITRGLLTQPQVLANLDTLPSPTTEPGECIWVRVSGMGEIAPLIRICEHYGIKRLALEDILNTGWRSKLEEHGEFLFFVLQTPPDFQAGLKGEHLALFCKEGLILTFEESPTTLVNCLWERLKSGAPAPRVSNQAGLLAHATLDAAIDSFFPLLDQKDETLARLEESLLRSTPSQDDLRHLHTVKRDLLTLRRLLSPYKELGAGLRHHRIAEKWQELIPYFSDLNDHVTQAAELITAYHEIADSLYDICQSTFSNRMNEIIRVLTLISTVFMPLSFMASLYGMNFEYMPELKSPYGYPIILLTMGSVFSGMIWFFKRKKWL